QGLLQDHAQHRACEIDVELTLVDRDLAGARLDPDAGDRVLALAGGIGTALAVELLLVARSLPRCAERAAEIFESLDIVGHRHQLRTFFLFSAATSSTCGCWAVWGCSAPA